MDYNITLDLSGERSIQQLHVKQGDVATVAITCDFTANNKPYSIPKGTKAYYSVRKPDGKQVVSDESAEIVGNTVVVTPTKQVFTSAGNAQMDIILVAGNEVKSTSTFTLVINPLGADNTIITSSDDYKAFTQALAEIDGAGDYANEQGDYAKTQGNYAKAQGSYAKSQGQYAKTTAETASEEAREDGKYTRQIGDDLQAKADRGDFNGKDAVVADIASDKYAFIINEHGHLILHYDDKSTPPSFEIDNRGHLIYEIKEV